MDLDPAQLSPRDRYKLLIGCIVPRPIALVSTISPDGRANLAPYSFFNGVGSDPMTVLFCPANNSRGEDKDTLRNCRPRSEGGLGVFTVNAAVEDYSREIAASAEDLPYGESEFDLTGLATAPGVRIAAPRVARAPWAFECETLQVVRMHPGVPGSGNVVIGKVVHVHLDEAIVGERLNIDPSALRAVGRMGGFWYARTQDRYEMPPGKGALGRPIP